MSESLTVVCWKWRAAGYKHKFSAEHVNTLQRMFARHYHRPHRFLCITDDATGVECETYPLWREHATVRNPTSALLPSCFRRLKLFAKEMLEPFGPRVLSLDLDMVITADVTEMLDVEADFIGWALPGTNHKRVYNGSLWMVRPGALDYVWRDFDPLTSPRMANRAGFLGSDQGWLSFLLANSGRPGWTRADGVYSYSRDIHSLPGRRLPEGARIVIHHGKYKPWLPATQAEAPWIKEHWQ